MNDFDNKAVGVDTSVKDASLTGNKPKMVVKDSSKYVKRKPSQKIPLASSNANLSLLTNPQVVQIQ